MAKRRGKTASAALHEPVSDYGPGYYRRNAQWVPNTRIAASDGIVLGDVADITRPDKRGATVRVALRGDPLRTILDIRDRDGPGGGQFLAAEKLRQVCQIANGSVQYGVGDLFDKVLRVGCAGDSQMPIISRVDAQTKARQAWQAIRGEENDVDVADVCRMVILGYATLQSVEKHRHWRHGKSRPMLETGLARLAKFYGTDR
jgi:hypothetical protein